MKSYIKIITTLSLLAMTLSSCGGNKKPSESSESLSESSTSMIESSSESESESESSTTSSVEETYTVVWKNYDGTVLETDTEVVKGSTPSYDGATPTKPDDAEYEYTFASWTPALSPVMSNQEYTATYNRAKIQYTISFELSGGTSTIYDGQPKVVSAFTKDIFFFDLVKEGWNFRGWSYNNTKIFDEKGNQLANPVMAKQMTFVALFSQTVKLDIVINIPGAGTVTGEGEYPYNSNVNLTATPNDGYSFGGWAVNNTVLSTNKNYNFKMWSDDVVIEAMFVSDKHSLTIDSNNETKGLVAIKAEGAPGYAKKVEEDHSYTEQVTVVAYSLDETRFLGWFDNNNELVTTNAIYSFIMPNDDYELHAIWNYFKVSYVLDGGTLIGKYDHYTLEEEILEFGEPVKASSEFLGWRVKAGDEVLDGYVNSLSASVMKDLTLYADWRVSKGGLKVRSYDVTKGIVSIRYDSGDGLSGDTMKVLAEAAEDCKFIGWYHDDSYLSDNTLYTFVMPSSNYEIVAHFMTNEEVGAKFIKEDGRVTYGLYPSKLIQNNNPIIAELNEQDEEYPRNNFTYYHGAFYKHQYSAWFKCEPVTWIKCGDDAHGAYYISERVIDSAKFSSDSSDFNYSDLLTKMSDMSHDMFWFDSLKIIVSDIDNSYDQHTGAGLYTSGLANIDAAKLFLPSFKELNTKKYGFGGDGAYEKRMCGYSDYSYYASTGFADGTLYWTRSPDPNLEHVVTSINFANGIIAEGYSAVSDVLGLRLAIYFDEA